MNNSQEEDEVNYWPSISDMFLVFFVLALTIVATTSQMADEGDKYALADVIEESNKLFETIGWNEKKIEISKTLLSVENSGSSQDVLDEQLNTLALRLDEVNRAFENGSMKDMGLCQFPSIRDDGKDKLADSSEGYKTAIHNLARTVGIKEWYVHRYDKLMREINQSIDKKLQTGSGDSGKSLAKQVEDLDRQLSKLVKQPAAAADAPTEQKAAHAARMLKLLEKALAKLSQERDQLNSELAQLRREMEQLREEQEQLRQKLAKLTKLEEEQNKMDDRYRELADKVAEALKQYMNSADFPVTATQEERLEKLIDMLVKKLDETIVELENARPVKTVISDKIIYFETNRAVPMQRSGKEYEYREALNQVTAAAKKLHEAGKRVTIEVYGHTDDAGTRTIDGQKHNAWLGLERARAMVEEIRAKCALPDGVEIHAYSASYYIPTGYGRDDCRRIEVRILPKENDTL